MKFALLTKRHYTNKDLINDRFGRLFHLPIQLHDLGHEGIVISGDLHSGKKERQQINGVTFHSSPFSIFAYHSFIKYSRRILAEFKPDVLLASGDSYWGYLGLRLARKLNIPFVFDVYDDYTAFRTNKIPGMKTIFYKAAGKADLVVTSSEPLRQKLNSFNKNILITENGFDPDLFRPIPKEKIRAQLNIPLGDTVIGYFGSITGDLGIEVLLKSIEILQKQIPGFRLLLAGLNGMNLDLKVPGVDFRGFLPQQEIPALINACDVVIIPYLPSKQVQQSNACKIAEYIACQVPIVATNVSNHAKIFVDAPQSLCEPGNPESMARAIQAQFDSPQLVENSGSLTWRNLAEKLGLSLEILVKTS